SIGYGASLKDHETDSINLLNSVDTQDLHKFGMIPEFVGRLPVRAILEELDETQLMSVLVRPKNAIIKQYIKLFGLEQIELEFTEDGLYEIAKACIKDKSGARGLRSLLEKKLLQLQYSLPDLKDQNVKKITINHDFIKNGSDPL